MQLAVTNLFRHRQAIAWAVAAAIIIAIVTVAMARPGSSSSQQPSAHPDASENPVMDYFATTDSATSVSIDHFNRQSSSSGGENTSTTSSTVTIDGQTLNVSSNSTNGQTTVKVNRH